jgi:DMSO/TMAO reductase YedYZ molybdopterin-dependent catalytic subunit
MMTTEKRTVVPGGFGAGVGAAVVMMLVMALLRFTTNTITIPELMEESLIRLTGGKIEAFFINLLGVGGKALLLVTIAEGTLLLGGLLGLGFTRLWPALAGLGRWPAAVVYGLIVGLLLNAVVLPLVNQGFFGSTALEVTAPPELSKTLYGTTLAPIGLPVWLTMFVLSVVFGLALVALLPWKRAVTVTATPPLTPTEGSEAAWASPSTEPADMPRRDFNKAAGGALLALLGGVVLWFGIRTALAPPPVAGVQEVTDEPPTPEPQSTTVAQAQPTGDATHISEANPTAEMTEVPATPPVPPGFEGVKPKLVPEVTPVDSFYITTKNFIDPTVNGDSWKLDFRGMVDKPYSINLKELQAMPSVDRIETLACISNPIGGSLIGNARWKGVNFAELIKRAGPQKGVVDVIVRGADGYADSFPIEAALNNECVLVYQMNGAALTQKHGYPARLLVPGIYGMKNCKWITQVELVNDDFKGYWESQGWSDVAHYQTLSRIDYPDSNRIPAKPIYVGGVAFAGDRGIKRVEVSTDGGNTWNEAALRRPMAKYTWTLWTYPWLPKEGTYTLKVRATDGTGQVQPADIQDTFPDGATGYHTIQVRVG